MEREVIGEARRRFADHDRLWARPLVQTLERAQQGLAARWLLEATRRVLASGGPRPAERQSPKFDQWPTYLTELETALSKIETPADLPADALAVRARDVWECGGPVSLFQRAISRLFGALAALGKGDVNAYMHEVVRSASLLVDSVDDTRRRAEARPRRAEARPRVGPIFPRTPLSPASGGAPDLSGTIKWWPDGVSSQEFETA